ncbi:protein of unknown function [Anaerovirgula multivorans]|uniref:DUF4364 family protein n=1 Tax=Anaerovirgula multivorans TaxID=312168 RepID=A0A239BFJ6_9FIRM|nr:DUF4364 family protein [Anaerovirgula multivorans]SNS06118.1 protein of unknown function [Anaerovirgula multivorans]
MFTNTPQQLAEKKLLLLYILDKINQPLSNAQVTQFILENDMMNYFMLQQFLSELKEAEFVTEGERDHTQFFSITEKGRNTLNYFINRIPNSEKEEINKLISEKKNILKVETEIRAEYIKLKEEVYTVKLAIIEDHTPIVHFKFNVNSLKRAKEICEKWEKDALNVCNNIFALL